MNADQIIDAMKRTGYPSFVVAEVAKLRNALQETLDRDAAQAPVAATTADTKKGK